MIKPLSGCVSARVRANHKGGGELLVGGFGNIKKAVSERETDFRNGSSTLELV